MDSRTQFIEKKVAFAQLGMAVNKFDRFIQRHSIDALTATDRFKLEQFKNRLEKIFSLTQEEI